MLDQQKIGVIGMGIMGRNLALNIESKGYCVSVYNRSREKVDKIIADNPKRKLIPYYLIKDFVLSLTKPRLVFLMITAGEYIDCIIQELLPYLNIGDVLIDGGNSFYKDTMRRNLMLSKKGINFIGTGISGGELGALMGPAIMPGGQKEGYEIVAPIFNKIAARIDNDVCVKYIGPDGSGHYVKMIHNGVEYGEMQLIAEIYSFLRNVLHLDYEELGEIFKEWNRGELNSYLIEITAHIITKKDDNAQYLLDSVLDIAEGKGTGMWASQNAFDLGIPCSMISESVFARYLSALKEQRVKASKILTGPIIHCSYPLRKIHEFVEKAQKALYFSKIILYAQGFYQLKVASCKYCWNLDCAQIARIFRAGCIIRTDFLKKIIQIYTRNPKIDNLLFDEYCVTIMNNDHNMLRDVIICGIRHGLPMSALSAAMAYYDGYRSNVLPANLIQAQRDCFGAHTYVKVNQEGVFHSKWLNEE